MLAVFFKCTNIQSSEICRHKPFPPARFLSFRLSLLGVLLLLSRSYLTIKFLLRQFSCSKFRISLNLETESLFLLVTIIFKNTTHITPFGLHIQKHTVFTAFQKGICLCTFLTSRLRNPPSWAEVTWGELSNHSHDFPSKFLKVLTDDTVNAPEQRARMTELSAHQFTSING